MNDSIRLQFECAGQGQVFRFFDSLPTALQDQLLHEAATINLEEISSLVDSLVLHHRPDDSLPLAGISPAPYIPVPEHGGSSEEWQAAGLAGEQALRQGRVAAFVVAGGQGTRLGFEGPKGTFPITPVTKKPLFHVFAEKIRTASRRYHVSIPWFILTSRLNHQATTSFFADHQFFGLPEEDVFFLTQGVMPAVDLQGKILLQDKHQIALNPDGHGGSLRALVRGGAIEVMQQRGIDLLSYFQVDNPLVRCLDPAFLGFHLTRGSELSSKACLKAYSEEKVGVFVQSGNQIRVVEYIDFPEDLTQALDEDGRLTYRAGSIAIHIFSRDLIERLGSSSPGAASLPFHRALKKIPTVDEHGLPFDPPAPNGIKFEAFVFDAIPMARHPLIVETLRQDEFSPVKNGEGVDSPQTAHDDQLRQFTRWALSAGLSLPTASTGLPAFPFEVSPLYADSAVAFLERVRQSPPTLAPNTVLS